MQNSLWPSIPSGTGLSPQQAECSIEGAEQACLRWTPGSLNKGPRSAPEIL
jgi:hypothetical protein